MTVVLGLPLSFAHNQNGMTYADMEACVATANTTNEVIIFRSTGPWAKRWIERHYPTKNFHVKGKSSDWGPHAGLVPYDGTYSKVGYDTEKAAKGTQANIDGLHSGFAGRAPLVLTRDQIMEQANRPEGRPPRTALFAVVNDANGRDMTLTARRSGDGLQVIFLARQRGDGRYDILVFPNRAPAGQGAMAAKGLVSNNAFLARDRDKTGASAIPLEVMTSLEVGGNAPLPMTGDYDLMAVCPTWADYGSKTAIEISKADITLRNGTTSTGLSFAPGVGMDNVMDSRLATGGTAAMDFRNRVARYRQGVRNGTAAQGTYREDTLKLIFGASRYGEHGDMGNLTPRILRCITLLNANMGATGANSWLRRVHHNAESHRFRQFGALTATDMVTLKDGEAYGDGFPLTVFQPRKLFQTDTPVRRYGDVCTLETLADFQEYAVALAGSGYYVPKNWIWNMYVSPAVRAAALAQA